MKPVLIATILLLSLTSIACKKKTDEPAATGPEKYTWQEFVMGADLSYVNQVEDHGGIYRDSARVSDPFFLFAAHGCNTVRVRLWHDPVWTKTVYGDAGTRMYSDLADAEKTIRRARQAGMAVNLDFHYSDTWADPDHQDVPAAWGAITSLETLKDSIYNYTFGVMHYLASKGLLPEMVQIGNEINCGMMITGKNSGFPDLNACNGKWQALGEVLNEAIRAVKDASANAGTTPQIILHVADPVNVEWWFDNIKSKANVKDFDIIGISYYPLWHKGVAFSELGAQISKFRSKYFKKVMIVETAYPWTTESDDNYINLFGSQTPLQGFPFTPEGQYNFMTTLTQKVISAGGSGVITWEPAWITSQLVTPWGTGSAWENATFFDFTGNTIEGINFMNQHYQFP